MSRKHVTVALSGDGADELFGGYITYQADNWARYLRRVPSGVDTPRFGSASEICGSNRIRNEPARFECSD